MDIAKIIGTVVCTQKVDALEGITLLLIQPVNERLEPYGNALVASDSSNRRGVGELVFFVASGDAVYTGPAGRDLPVDAAILGIIDDLYIPGASR